MKSKKRTRNLLETRANLLQAAFKEFFARGFNATSIDTLIERTCLTKGALFHQFPTKLDLGYAVVDEVLVPMIHERWITPLEGYINPLEGIVAVFKKNVIEQTSEQLKLGCPLNNLVQEMSAIDRKFQKHLSRALEVWIEGLASKISVAQKKGVIAKVQKPKDIAIYIVTLHEGCYGMIKGTGDKSYADAVLRALELYFRALTPV